MASLYQRLLGNAWNDLDAAVRFMHLVEGEVRAAGMFRVRVGRGWPARGLARFLRMPSAGDAVPTRLIVRADGQREEWVRAFECRKLVTMQWEGPDRTLIERWGILAFRFHLEVVGRTLRYQQIGVALRLGPISVPMPRRLAPQVVAEEGPDGGENQSRVSVQVHVPFVGLLVAYEGTLIGEEPM